MDGMQIGISTQVFICVMPNGPNDRMANPSQSVGSTRKVLKQDGNTWAETLGWVCDHRPWGDVQRRVTGMSEGRRRMGGQWVRVDMEGQSQLLQVTLKRLSVIWKGYRDTHYLEEDDIMVTREKSSKFSYQ